MGADAGGPVRVGEVMSRPLAEEWRPIPGLDDRYEASSLGRIRRTRRFPYSSEPAGSIVHLPIGSSGYPRLVTFIGGKPLTLNAHRLIAGAFHGPIPEGMQVAHLNGVRTDIRPENLAIVTKQENESHKALHGTLTYGERNGCAKLTAAQVLEIRQSDEPRGVLAARYGIRPSHVYRLRTGRRWAHLAETADV
jgi:hypothetical protein